MSEGCSLEAWPRRFKAVTDLDSRDGEKTNPAANRLVVVVIGEREFERAGPAGIEGVKARPVRNIKGVIRARRTDGNSAAHLEADRSYRQNAAVVNSQGVVGQFVDPGWLEAFGKNIARGEKFSSAQGDVVVEQVGELRVLELDMSVAAIALDVQMALE